MDKPKSGSKQRLKSSANRSISAQDTKRPPTAQQQSKFPSPREDLKLRTVQMQGHNEEPVEVMFQTSMLDPPTKSKYQSTREQKHSREAITGKKVMQPKLIVSSNVDHPRVSPTYIARALKLKQKKSKSQTISAQNLKSKKRRGLIDFLDTSVHPHKQSQHEDEKDLTLKILNSSADNVSKYRTRTNKVQMKAINYQRKKVQTQQRPLNKTQSTSADRQRLTGSLSPRSKTGNAFSRVLYDDRKYKSREILTRSAVDIPPGMSVLERQIHNESDLILKKHQNTSAQPFDAHVQFFPPDKNQRSNPNMRKQKRSISPDRVSKIEKLMRDNIREKCQVIESKRREIKEREASSQRRKNLLEQKNQCIRKLNHEKIQRRRLKLKDNMTIFGEERDPNETKLFEEALLAVSDGANLLDEKQFNSKLSTNVLKKSKNALQSKIRQALLEMPSRTQGMDFIEVRKEISNELKQLKNKKKSWIDSTFNLQTSKSHPKQIHHSSMSYNPEKGKLLSQIKEGNMLGKRDKIRKFMKEKAKQLQSKAEQQRTAELNSVKKVKCNLSKLNKFTSARVSTGITTPHLKVKRTIKKNVSSVYDDERRHSQGKAKKYTALRHQDITPSRTGIFEQSDASFNISANRGANNRSVFGHLTQKDLQKLHDTLYEDSRLSSIDTHNDERSQKRAASKVLAVCFEKSASQKGFRKSSHSPNSKRNISNKSKRPTSALSLSKSAKRKVKSAPKYRPKKHLVNVQAKLCRSAQKSENEEMTLKFQMNDQAAALVIQKEVRKFLANLGFYEARQKSPLLSSPDRNQINLYIQPRSMSSKRTTPLRSRSSSRRTRSPDYELIDLKSSKKSSIKLHISPGQLRQILREEAKQLTLIASEGIQETSDEQKSQKQQDKVPPLQWGGGVIQTVVSSPNHSHRNSQSSNSIFDRKTFQQHSQQDLAKLIQNNEFQKLIQVREECVSQREQKEKKLIQKLYQDNQMTPRTYSQRHQQIEKWVSVQRKEIERTKIGFNEEWDKTLQMIEETQKGVDQVKMKIGTDSGSYSQASSRANGQSKPPKSILIDEAPRSYRNKPLQEFEQESSPGLQTDRSTRVIDSELLQLQLGIKQKSRQDQLQDNSMTEVPVSDNELPRTYLQQSMTSEKDRQLQSQHKRINSGDMESQQPSQEFINRLERAMLQGGSKEGSLKMEEDFEKHQQSDTFEDGHFKNKLVQLKDLMFDQEIQKESSSEHKSEPMMVEDTNQDSDDLNQKRISEILKRSSQANKPSEIVKTLKQNTAQLINNQMADQLTEQLMETILKECLQLPKRAKDNEPPPLPDQIEHHTFDSIEKEEKKEWIEIRQRHLIEGNLIRADQYVNEVVDALLQFDISDLSENSDFDYEVHPSDNFHIQFLKQLTQPILRPFTDGLELIQKSELGSYQHFETIIDASKHPIVSMEMYLDIEKQREKSFSKRKAQADKRTLQIWESIHIFNKCVFDSINESLMKFRPYGLVGQPMPWSNKVRRLQTKVEIASVDTERLFQMVKQEIFRWSQVLCGCMPGPVFYFPSLKSGKDEFQEDLFQEVRERRLTQILTSDQIEQEHQWLNYEFEETQVKIDLSDMILEALVQEMIGLLNQ